MIASTSLPKPDRHVRIVRGDASLTAEFDKGVDGLRDRVKASHPTFSTAFEQFLYDFGYRGPGSIGDTVFLDVNQNGVADPGEGISNVAVTLTGDLDGDGFGEGHPAKRVFQALRIAVNDELGALETALDGAIGLLAGGGRIVVLTYHSLEDRIVKRAFAAAVRGCICPPRAPACGCGKTPTLRLLHRKPLGAADGEVSSNPRSRSAKLRAAERIGVAA